MQRIANKLTQIEMANCCGLNRIGWRALRERIRAVGLGIGWVFFIICLFASLYILTNSSHNRGLDTLTIGEYLLVLFSRCKRALNIIIVKNARVKWRKPLIARE